ncbi:probable glycosyltransferase At5g03795, partial [Henckelia pumila]|uniref:probable glycosyltransferase At5g03795 n=1 Tax=Henckelia pumila TaxID=405737 RepID=UPI003C6E8510
KFNFFSNFCLFWFSVQQWNEIVGGDVYHSEDVFQRNYDEMESKFKIYSYNRDDDDDDDDDTPRSIHWTYASESYFFKNIRESWFLTDDPHLAHLFFIPLSCHKIRQKIFLTMNIDDYCLLFMIKSNFVPSIRGVCSSSYVDRDGFIPHKDFAIPQINQPFAQPAGGNETHRRYCIVYVILGDHFDLPFVDILEWRKFALLLKEADVYILKDILKAKAGAEYRMLHNNLLKVQKHFRWNTPPVKLDAFHMVIYDLWLRRNVVK